MSQRAPEPLFPAPVGPVSQPKQEITMESGYFLAALSLFTFVAVIIVALVSKKKTEDRLHDPAAHKTENKSTLAKDAPNEHR
jgi:hypothetical protein